MPYKRHDLKCAREPFGAVVRGLKKWEFRRDDRGFEVGHDVFLHELIHAPGASRGSASPGVPSGRYVEARIIYLLRGPEFGIPEGFAVFSIEILNVHV